jgi:transposase InsO family protein
MVKVDQQRMEFVTAAGRKEKPFSQLCAQYEISRPTGYLWCKRYRAGGVEAVQEQSRKPHKSPTKTKGSVEQQVVKLWQCYPDWGARKLGLRLKEQCGRELPSSTIHRILRRHNLVEQRQQRSREYRRFERSRANELWQMDFKGPRGWNQDVGPLSILDDHSRYLIVLQALGSTQAEGVEEQLQEAFQRCGVPEGMLMDHGIPWWGSRSPLGLTKLSVWLMRQGIQLYWSGVRHPETQGKVERFHGTFARALQKRRDIQKTQQWLDSYRWEYNHVRPHEALGMKTPATMWTPSERKYEANPRNWEYPASALLRKVDVDGKLQVDGRQWHFSRALSGQWVRIVRLEQRVLAYYCNTLIRELNLSTGKSVLINRWVC